MSEVLGAVLTGKPGSQPSLDIHFRSGGPIEVRTTAAEVRAIGIDTSEANVRLLQELPQQQG